MTAYLKKQIEDKQLDTIYNAGRILRIRKKGDESNITSLNQLANIELLALLSDKNGWKRERAQQLLILRQATEVGPELEGIISTSDDHLAQLHALWTLEGLGAINENTILRI